jgi:hypothetical protein
VSAGETTVWTSCNRSKVNGLFPGFMNVVSWKSANETYRV